MPHCAPPPPSPPASRRPAPRRRGGAARLFDLVHKLLTGGAALATLLRLLF
ncbi:hypothetical protein [Falsiroseomonas oryzae]|uniref:hypothetical protein n=1 Tax=Falsiroseomonas oryzae TaxID=2766473 RepID=UPI0022EB5686|nr:hypothetical protein [Roseomonas sp. MO-31]